MALKVLPETRLKCTSQRRAIVFFYTIANRIVRDAEAMHVSLILFFIHFILNEKIFQNNNKKENNLSLLREAKRHVMIII